MGIVNDIQGCVSCDLCRNMLTAPVKPIWQGKPSIMFIIGSPMTGQADWFQDPIPHAANKRRFVSLMSQVTDLDWYITPLVKCIPQNKDRFLVSEIRFCVDKWIDYEISVVKPKFIFGLGGNVKKYVDVIHEFPTIAKIVESRTQEKLFKGSLKAFLDGN